MILPTIVPATVLSQSPPSKRITLAFIGVGNQGTNNLKGFLQLKEAQVVAVCDVNRASYGYKTAGQFLGREPAAERFTNDEAANRMLSKPYRAPWHL